jgi:hypothetical protein
MQGEEYRKIRVLVETGERSFKGLVHVPVEDGMRLSDYLNHYKESFLRLSDVEITERGQHYRVGDRQPFVAISVSSITYISPLEGE